MSTLKKNQKMGTHVSMTEWCLFPGTAELHFQPAIDTGFIMILNCTHPKCDDYPQSKRRKDDKPNYPRSNTRSDKRKTEAVGISLLKIELISAWAETVISR